MSTKSTIWMKEGNKWAGIYCGYDGYLSGVGQILRKYYTSNSKVEDLISLGDIVHLEPEIGSKHDCDDNDSGFVTAYNRDCEEYWNKCAPKFARNIKQILDISDDYGALYIYLWDGDKWNCYDPIHERWIFGNNPEGDEIEEIRYNKRRSTASRMDNMLENLGVIKRGR